jgi:hypothetical protein
MDHGAGCRDILFLEPTARLRTLRRISFPPEAAFNPTIIGTLFGIRKKNRIFPGAAEPQPISVLRWNRKSSLSGEL